MALCCRATKHYMNQYWLWSMSTYNVRRPQWGKPLLSAVSVNDANYPIIWWKQIKLRDISQLGYDYLTFNIYIYIYINDCFQFHFSYSFFLLAMFERNTNVWNFLIHGSFQGITNPSQVQPSFIPCSKASKVSNNKLSCEHVAVSCIIHAPT